MKLNAVLVFLILTATFVILLTSFLSGRSVLRPKASALTSNTSRSKVLIDTSRPLYLSSPSRPVVADITDVYPGNEVSYITQNGDLYVYSSKLVYIARYVHAVDATVSARLDVLSAVPMQNGLNNLHIMTDKQSALYYLDQAAQNIVATAQTVTPTPLLLPDDMIVYSTMNSSDQLPSAFFTRKVHGAGTAPRSDFNELVVISSVDKNNPQDALRVTSEYLKNE